MSKFKPGEIVFAEGLVARVEVIHTDSRIDVKTEKGETKTYPLEEQEPEVFGGKVFSAKIEFSAGQGVEVLSSSHGGTFVDAHVVNAHDHGTLDVKYATGETKTIPWQFWPTQVKRLELSYFVGGGAINHAIRQSFAPVFSWDMSLNDFCSYMSANGIYFQGPSPCPMEYTFREADDDAGGFLFATSRGLTLQPLQQPSQADGARYTCAAHGTMTLRQLNITQNRAWFKPIYD